MAAALLNALAGSHLVHFRVRTLLYRLAGCDVHLRTRVSPGVILRTNALTLGRGSTINYRCTFDNRARVTIGERVGVGMDVRFITSGHDMSDPACRAGVGTLQPIVVGDGAWIGSGATILGGVTIGAGAVVAAGAVVVSDCDPHTVYAGVPAKAKRTLTGVPVDHGTV